MARIYQEIVFAITPTLACKKERSISEACNYCYAKSSSSLYDYSGKNSRWGSFLLSLSVGVEQM